MNISFATDLLEIDAALWGGFWQGDVLSPGYLLPVGELNLLRAVRLAETWPPDTTLDTFLADARQILQDVRAGRWTLTLAGEPCVVVAAGEAQLTVVWYCATTDRLHAMYRVSVGDFCLPHPVEEQQPLIIVGQRIPIRGVDIPPAEEPGLSRAARLDYAIRACLCE